MKKLNKKLAINNSIEAYACSCACVVSCGCTCTPIAEYSAGYNGTYTARHSYLYSSTSVVNQYK